MIKRMIEIAASFAVVVALTAAAMSQQEAKATDVRVDCFAHAMTDRAWNRLHMGGGE